MAAMKYIKPCHYCVQTRDFQSCRQSVADCRTIVRRDRFAKTSTTGIGVFGSVAGCPGKQCGPETRLITTWFQ
jgi:hypothetical protein